MTRNLRPKEPRPHPLAFVGFLLAVLVLIAPTQSDLVFSFLSQGRILPALSAAVATLSIVVLPLAVAEIQTRRHPNRWRPRLLGKMGWAIVMVNAGVNVCILADAFLGMGGDTIHIPYPDVLFRNG